jgi:hypothetical protein
MAASLCRPGKYRAGTFRPGETEPRDISAGAAGGVVITMQVGT